MITPEEASNNYERIVKPFRTALERCALDDPNRLKRWQEFVIVVEREGPKVDLIRQFWRGNPTQQLCAVAQMLETGEQP